MLKIKYYQATVWEVFKKRPADEIYRLLTSKATQNNYEITIMTLKGETFAGFKIHNNIDGFLFCN